MTVGEDTRMPDRKAFSRRRFLATAAAVPPAVLAAPYVKTANAAGTLSIGFWDHWVPGANEATTALANEWAKQENVEIKIDYITSQGRKLLLTWAAEAQAQSGHDVMSFSTWYPAQFNDSLEPMNEIVDEMIGVNGPVNATVEYMGTLDGKWMAAPFTAGSQMKGPCSRVDLLKKHAGIDIQAMYPAGSPPEAGNWTTAAFMEAAKACHAGGNPIGIGLGVTSDSVDSVGAFFNNHGAALVTADGDINVRSDEIRAAVEYLVELGPYLAPDAPAWDDASNNKWLVSGQGSMIWNPPSAWAVAVRDAPEIAQNLWTHGAPEGPAGRFCPFLPFFLGVWQFSPNKEAAKSFVRFMSQESSAKRMVEASKGYDIPAYANMTKFKTWEEVGPPPGTLYHYPDPHSHQTLSVAGAPAPHAIAQQIFAQGLMPKMIVRVMQGESMDDMLSWAESELEGYMRG